MPQITIWKCPSTGTLFEDKAAYREHLRKLATKRIARRNYLQFADAGLVELHKASSFDEISNWMIANSNWLAARAAFLQVLKGRREEFLPTVTFRLTKFHFNRWWHDEQPIMEIKGKKSLLGFSGNMSLSYTGDYVGFVTDFLEGTGIYTGSGSGNNNRFNCQFHLCYEDWTSLAVMNRIRYTEKN